MLVMLEGIEADEKVTADDALPALPANRRIKEAVNAEVATFSQGCW
jgi:hypothetical protein